LDSYAIGFDEMIKMTDDLIIQSQQASP